MKNLILTLTIIAAVAVFRCAWSQEGSRSTRNNGAVQVQMHNVMYHYSDSIAVHLINVAGSLIPATAGKFPVFDDKNSFVLHISAAEIAIDPQSLANVLNTNVFSAKNAPLKDISIRIEHGRLKVKGKLHNQGDISFETEGEMTPTNDGKIRLHAEKIKAMHLPVKGLMGLFGVDIADLIKNGKVKGVQAEKNDLILDPGQILPPPRISGKITGIRLEANSIVQIIGEPQKFSWARFPAQNYMAYHGNRLQFGKLTMSDTDMILIDPDPSDPFDFYLDHYKEQLVAGYSKTTRSFGLQVYMVDFNKLRSKNAAASKSRKSGQHVAAQGRPM